MKETPYFCCQSRMMIQISKPMKKTSAAAWALKSDSEDVDGRGHFLKQIEDQGNRLHALIIDLLALARVESGSEVFDFQEIDLAESIADCMERLDARAKARGQTLAVDIHTSKGGTTIWADHESIRQILDNLVDNAIKYTPENGNGSRWMGSDISFFWKW